MTSRPIVRTPEVLSGRWRIDGTDIAVAAIREDIGLGLKELTRLYQDANLTNEEIQAALGFRFPPVRDVIVEHFLTSLTVHCECGEDTPHAAIGEEVQVKCVCGRIWRISLNIERLTEPDQPELIDERDVL
jgi:uncharacterized protein (DUF433 family)